EKEANDRADRDGRQADEDATTQLLEMLDERHRRALVLLVIVVGDVWRGGARRLELFGHAVDVAHSHRIPPAFPLRSPWRVTWTACVAARPAAVVGFALTPARSWWARSTQDALAPSPAAARASRRASRSPRAWISGIP